MVVLQRVYQKKLWINAPKLAIVSTHHMTQWLAHVLLVDVNVDMQDVPVVEVCINALF